MKPRNLIIYLLIFSVLVGFYYYDVTKKKQHQKAQKAMKRVFPFTTSEIDNISIKGEKSIHLIKTDGRWHIIKPIKADTDRLAVDELIRGLKELEKIHWFKISPKDLSRFGLDNPRWTIRFENNGRWYVLNVGNETPVKNGYYASLSENNEIFIISKSDYSRLNKDLDELRRRDLFSFNEEDIDLVKITWKDGSTFTIRHDKTCDRWQLEGHSKVRLKKAKVENVIDQIHWLRAERFLEEGTKNRAKYGLDSPKVTIQLATKDEYKKWSLEIGSKLNGKELAVISSELPNIVAVNSDILSDIPKKTEDLEDRSLLTFDPELIQRVVWKVGNHSGEVMKTAGDRWKWLSKNGKEEILKESWRVRSLFWELEDDEFSSRILPPSPMPVDPHGRIDFYADKKLLGYIVWSKPDDTSAVSCWIHQGDINLNVKVAAKVIKAIEEKVETIKPSKDG